jgi:[acyl-carrier-protein] S-malonyltransferase
MAEGVSGLPIRRLSLEGPQEELTRTEVAQPALFVLSLALAQLAREAGISADLVAGHSLGEYTAAVAADSLPVEAGMRLVARRGSLMAEIQSERPGSMAAIIGLELNEVEKLCEAASEGQVLEPANLNAPTQIVVSGETDAVERIVQLASAHGAKRAVRLQVGAAFHSQMMRSVQRDLAEAMSSITWSDPRVPMASNASGKLARSAREVRQALTDQIASPVRWVKCVESMVEHGCESFLELGPGRVLGGLVRQTEPSVRTFAADSPEKLQQFSATLM